MTTARCHISSELPAACVLRMVNDCPYLGYFYRLTLMYMQACAEHPEKRRKSADMARLGAG